LFPETIPRISFYLFIYFFSSSLPLSSSVWLATSYKGGGRREKEKEKREKERKKI